MNNEIETNGLEIAIIGIGCNFPKAPNKQAFWDLLQSGQSGITHYSKEELMNSGISTNVLNNPKYVRAKGMISEIEWFDHDYFQYKPDEACLLNPQHRILLECANDALLDGGYSKNSSNLQIGVYASEATNDYLNQILEDGTNAHNISELLCMNDKDYAATTISYRLNLHGPSITTLTACSSSLVAVHLACQGLLSGDADMALAGGISISLPNKNGYWYSSKSNHSPDGVCRVFSDDAMGTVPADGGGMVLLKRYSDAIEDQDSIYCIIKASFINNDGNRKVNYIAPSEEGQYEVIKNAFEIADINPSTISYVEAHGTGTIIGDSIEVAALTKAFRMFTQEKQFCGIGSVDSYLGHSDSAAGVASLIKSALMIKNRYLIKNLNFHKPNPNIDFESSPFYVIKEHEYWEQKNHPIRATVSSFGKGGTNAFIILEEAKRFPQQDGDDYKILPLSAHKENGLKRLETDLLTYLISTKNRNLLNLAYTYTKEYKTYDYRKYYVFKSRKNLIDQLRSESNIKADIKNKQSSVVFLFSGQGAQYIRMGQDLYKNSQIFRKYFDRCVEILSQNYGFDYFSYRPKEENIKKDILLSQLSIFIVEYAMFNTLSDIGIKPSVLIGHSLGEYVAATVAGVFTLEDALFLIYKRALLIQKTPMGQMIVVFKTEKTIKKYLSESVSIAAINDQFSVTLSGATDDIEKIKDILHKESIAYFDLGGNIAIHSPLMDQISQEYRNILEKVPKHKPTIAWMSTVDVKFAEENVTQNEYWIKNLRQAVNFFEGIKQIKKQYGNRLYLELGPGNALSSLVRTITREDICYPLFRSDFVLKGIKSFTNQDIPEEYESFLHIIGMLWQGQHIHDLDFVYNHMDIPKTAMLPYPYIRKPFWYNHKELKNEACNLDKNIYQGPRNEIEVILTHMWEQVLGLDKVGINEYFHDLGGNSLKLIELQVMLEKENIKINVDELYKHQTISKLAFHLMGEGYTNVIANKESMQSLVSDSVVLSNIKPFNKFLYKNCFYNLAFSILDSKAISPMAILQNDILIYSLDNDIISVEYKANLGIEDVFQGIGIGVQGKVVKENLISTIRQALTGQKPVLINIDCFFERSRPETYQKEHRSHMLLIYGYNDVQQVFYKIERRYFDTLSYEFGEISYEVLTQMHKGYIDYLQDNNKESFSYYEFTSRVKQNIDDHAGNYMCYFYENSEIIKESIEKLLRFKDIYTHIVHDKERLTERTKDVIDHLNDVINAKKVERYKLSHLHQASIMELIDNVIDLWEKIRAILLRYHYSNNYKTNSIEQSIENLALIYELERDMVQRIKKNSKSIL